MNRKGNMDGIGIIFGAFIVIIVGLAIMTGAVLPNIGSVTLESTRTNETHSMLNTSGGCCGAVTQGSYELTDAQAISDLILAGRDYDTNTSLVLTEDNYTIQNNIVPGSGQPNAGDLLTRVSFTSNGLNGSWSAFDITAMNFSYTFEPVGYVSNAGARSLVILIAVFMALAIVVVAIIPSLRMGIMDVFKG